ncbi:MAG: hypothetical protein OXG35_12890 [Acidobacteria bacterium]|nr:hypothetical protein [Acidobacteriota bacterium]
MTETDDCPCVDGSDHDAPQPSYCRVSTRRAAKRYSCYECRDPIEPGAQYENVHGLWEGEWDTMRICAGCADIRRELFCGPWSYGEMWDDLRAADVLLPRMAPKACFLKNLSAAGAAKLKAQWARFTGLQNATQ